MDELDKDLDSAGMHIDGEGWWKLVPSLTKIDGEEEDGDEDEAPM